MYERIETLRNFDLAGRIVHVGSSYPWNSCNQAFFARSAREAEPNAMCKVCENSKMNLNARGRFREILNSVSSVFDNNTVSNQSAEYINGIIGTEHVNIWHHLVKTSATEGVVESMASNSSENPGGGLENPLRKYQVENFRDLSCIWLFW